MVLAEDLRQAVLQAALQGKLTEQLETDSDVDELLECIQEEKEKLIADGKIKKEKLLPEIQEGEIPFDIPDNWRWVRIGQLVDIKNGFTPKKTDETLWNPKEIPWFTVDDIHEQGLIIYHTAQAISQKALGKSTNRIIPAHTVLLCCTSATIGRYAMTEIELTTNQQWNGLVIKDENKAIVCADYILVWVSSLKEKMMEIAKSTTFPFLSVDKLADFVIMLPPIEEQQRIVDKINEIMPKIDEYEKIEKELETIKKEFPADMKDALLQAAMQGKLTEQLESDSSVDELLASIKKEKEELIAQKKIKKEKPLPDIEGEEIPFDIPGNWRWVRWGNLAYSIQYGYNAPAQETGKIKMVRISDIHDNSVDWNSVPYCDIKDEEIETYLLQKNDILFARTGGTVGKSFLVNDILEDAIYAGYLIRTRYNNQLVSRYLKLFMESQLYWVQLQNGKTQGCQPNCNGQTLSKMIIPLPPIEEQQRIVERLDALLPLCMDLKEE